MTQATSQAMPHKDPRANISDRIVFVLFVFVGSTGIVWLRTQDYGHMWVIGVPALLITAYALTALLSKGFYLREDRSADNCYYLGFIFTLVSLAYALYAFETKGKATDELIQSFGIALASTIVGLFFRLLLNQLRTDPVEVEREARLELSDTARQLRSELQQAVADVNSYRRSLFQSLEEAMQDVAERANRSVTDSTERFEQVTGKLVERVDSSFEAYYRNAERLTEVSGKTVAALEGVVTRIEAIEAPSDLIEKKLSPAVEQLSEAAQVASRRAGAEGKQIRRLGEMVQKAVAAAEQLDERLSKTAERDDASRQVAEELAAVVRGLQGEIEPIREALQGHARALDESRRELEETLQAIRTHNSELAAELEKSRNMTMRVHSDLAGFADLITERLGDEKPRTREAGGSDSGR